MATALITGASTGIGYELAVLFAKDKYDIIIVSRNKKRLQAAYDKLKTLGSKVTMIVQDLSQEGSAQKLFKKTGPVEVLINNAGFGDNSIFHEADDTKIHNMVMLNMVALTDLTILYVKDMVKKKDGKIMNVASIAAFMPGPYNATYFATKAYVLSFSEAIAFELKDSGVGVTALCPGATKTEFSKTANMKNAARFDARSMSAAQVAQQGYDALMKSKPVLVNGIQNKIMVSLVKMLPHRLTMALIKMMMGK